MPRGHREQALKPGECIRNVVNSYGNGGFCKKPAERRDRGRGLLFCDDCWEVVEGVLKAQFTDATARRLAISKQWN